MGYRADYFISTEKFIPSLAGDIEKESGYNTEENGMGEYGNDVHIYRARWDEMESDMVNISIRHKDTLFTVDETGDEDVYCKTYFKNGKALHSPGKIVYKEVDLSLLD
jgi:hypothetical protein